MELRDFEFALPEELIAQDPLPRRDQSRMMVVWRETRRWEHRTFQDLPEILTSKHFLVVNNTQVFPARLWARRPGTAEKIELLLTHEEAPGLWLALVRPGRKAIEGQWLEIASLRAQVREVRPDGRRLLRFDSPEELMKVANEVGEPPLPPYIRRTAGQNLSRDRERYQTVFARHSGSIAAPTAGLHFTPETLRRLEEQRVHRCEVLLHVGYGTFQPVRCARIEDHRMEPEYFHVTEESASCIQQHKNKGARLVAVGTTTTRVLEHVVRHQGSKIRPMSGWCNLFIYPGFQFRMLDGLLTNFHLPGSTLLMLVCAFGGQEFMLECYKEAVERRYRFFSYGDCMLVL